jgi:8-oxo-dGTP pyrophosphatase MutT (NUDIX family)
MVYEQYTWKPEYEGLPLTYGGFAIIPGVIEGRSAVCIKQRNGRGSSPYAFDLPGGGMDNTGTDPDLRATACREAKEEVGVNCFIEATIGTPLYLPIKNDSALVRVDCAQSFLIGTTDTPTVSEEALAVAFVHEKSFAGFNVVSRKADPSSPVFGRTPVMIFDGLSVLQKPFWEGELTDSLREHIVGGLDSHGFHTHRFMLVDDGNYFGRTVPMDGNEEGRGPFRLSLYCRLNPDQPDGYFHGVLDSLIS